MTARQRAGCRAAGMLAAFAAAPLAGAAADGRAQPNYSSHDAAFFARLVTGRAWILERPHGAGRGWVSGFHHAGDGSFRGCIFADGIHRTVTGTWTMTRSRAHRTVLARRLSAPAPGADSRGAGTPIFYEPDSGRLHTETWPHAAGRWSVASRGWVQESWPRALARACPDLGVPGGLALNARQVSLRIGRLRAEDPAAALRNVPGSERRPPGRLGMAMAGRGPAVTAAELAAFLVRNDGRILETHSGHRLVAVLGRGGDEVWRLGGDGKVMASGRLEASPEGDVIAIRWNGGGTPVRYRIGDPLPLWPTGRRHPAMAAMDAAVAAGRAVTLPADGGPAVRLRFFGGGRVSATGPGQAGPAGSWRWNGGRLVVRLDGEPVARIWPWRLFAAHVAGAAGAAPETSR